MIPGLKIERQPHGTRARYVGAKCRCALCKEANRVYYHARCARMLERLEVERPAPPPSRFLSTPAADKTIGQHWTRRDGTKAIRIYKRACPGVGRRKCPDRAHLRKDSKGGLCTRCRAKVVWEGLVDADPVRRHLVALSAKGVGYKTVAAAADVGKTILLGIMRGRRTQIRAESARRVLDVDEGAIADAAVVDATRTWTLLDELVGKGWTKSELARRLGSVARVPALQIRRDRCLARQALAVEKLHRAIVDEPPPAATWCSCRRPMELRRDREVWCARCDRKIRRVAA